MAGEKVNHIPHILVVDDEEGMCQSLKKLLDQKGFRVSTALSAKEGAKQLQRHQIDLIICDIVMPDMSGLTFLSNIGAQIPMIIMTAYASVETARKAFKMGACDYLVKPFDFEELLVVIHQNLSYTVYQEPTSHLISYQSEHPAYRKILEQAEKFGATDMPILICGESGTGKEVLADYIHSKSERNTKPYIKINCAAIPESLLESELFGYEKGAFTGAYSKKIGRFEEAHGGTLFLDEIGEMDVNLQAKLLRVLESFHFYRLGGKQTIDVDVRIIAATNKRPEQLVREKKLRADLFHRLNGVYFSLPPLRERTSDMENLSNFFLRQFTRKYKKTITGIDERTFQVFKTYSWPGNIRELKNYLERAVVICEDAFISPEHLPDSVHKHTHERTVEKEEDFSSKHAETRNEYMRKIIIKALNRSQGNREQAAKLLNISRKTLYNRMKELDIRHDFM